MHASALETSSTDGSQYEVEAASNKKPNAEARFSVKMTPV